MSDLAAARIYMELAAERLQGQDDFSRNAREALRIMVRAIDETGRRANAPIVKLQGMLNHNDAS